VARQAAGLALARVVVDHIGMPDAPTSARPGAVALRSLVLQHYPATGDSGIVRPCTAAELKNYSKIWERFKA